MASSMSENAWRQSEDYFTRIEVQLHQRHEEILARRAALMSGKEAFYDTTSGFPEIFIGSDAQARKRNDALFQTLQSIRHDLHQTPQEDAENLNRLKRAYLQSVQGSMAQWIDQLREFKLRQVQKIGEERWNADEDYQAIEAIIRYRPSHARPSASAAGASSFAGSFNASPEAAAAAFSSGRGGRQLAASVPDLSAAPQRPTAAGRGAAAAGDGDAAAGSRRRGSRLGAFLSSSWSNLRSRMSRSSGGGRR